MRRTLVITLLLLPLAARAESGGFLLSGGGAGLYDAHEWPEVVRSLVTIAVVLANDEDDWDYDGYEHRYADDCDEELGISIPQSQFDLGLSYFVSRDLAVGVRYLYSEDYRDDELSRLWGGGPEATLFMGSRSWDVRPFVGAGIVYTTGRSRRDAYTWKDGLATNLRAGLHVPAGDGGFVIQAGWRDDTFPTLDEPVTRRVAGLGIGFTARFD